MLISMAVSVVLSAIRDSVKNPAKKEKLRSTLLNIRDQINALYPGDEA